MYIQLVYGASRFTHNPNPANPEEIIPFHYTVFDRTFDGIDLFRWPCLSSFLILALTRLVDFVCSPFRYNRGRLLPLCALSPPHLTFGRTDSSRGTRFYLAYSKRLYDVSTLSAFRFIQPAYSLQYNSLSIIFLPAQPPLNPISI